MKGRERVNDLAIGVRLAVGGGRTAMARLALSTVGIALAVLVLLVAASVGTMSANRDVRQTAGSPTNERADVAPTYYLTTGTQFHGGFVRIIYVRGTGPDSPKPAGLPALPKPGEMYVSAALADLLRSTDGELLRPRLPKRIVGTLDKSLVVMPGDLMAWVGADEKLNDEAMAQQVYEFGQDPGSPDLDPAMVLVVLMGGVALLLPVFVFITTASRVAGAERDRRLSALRLVGAGARQVRRIAAAESLVSAMTGLALGTVLFLVGRQFAEDVSLFGEGVYVSDVVPNPALVVVIVLLIPVLSVLTAIFALRRTIIEPLGVVRQSKPVKRRVWWRVTVVALGVVLLATRLGVREESDLWGWLVAGGATLLLIGVHALLPWLVERVASQLRGGPPSWMLAIRRLQLDSGTSTRVVGGVAIVLTGMIAIQTMLVSLDSKKLGLPGGETQSPQGTLQFSTTSSLATNILNDVRHADGVRTAHQVRYLSGYEPGKEGTAGIAVADCAALRDLANVRDCQDGDTFAMRDAYSAPPPAAGTVIQFRKYLNTTNDNWDPNNYEVIANWTVPTKVKNAQLNNASPLYSPLIITPGALNGQKADDGSTSVVALVDNNLTADQLERIRNVIGDYGWQASVFSFGTGPELTINHGVSASIRNALYAGAVFTLLLAGLSMLVLALEHIRERRRSLAVLTASGVPRGVLARSLLWQVALPITLGVAMAILAGTGLAALLMRIIEIPLIVDWPSVTLLGAGAATLTLLVSAMTLPFLKNATRLTTLRAE